MSGSLLAIETSCDETAVAVFNSSGSLVSELVSSQVKLHQPYGGVVPELAAREHLTNLPILFNQVLNDAGIGNEDLVAIAATRGPGLNGCLLVGLAFARSFAAVRGITFIPVNHLEGHLFAGDLVEAPPELPFLALLVSGGNTAIVLVRGFRDYTIVAETLDDAVGETFDKVATMLGLGYPGGPALSRLAEVGDCERFPLPIGVEHNDTAFSFSGVKTAVLRLITDLKAERNGSTGQAELDRATASDVAASVENVLVKTLTLKLRAALSRYPEVRGLLLTGGVAANTRLRTSLSELAAECGMAFVVPPQRWCTDNAAMIGAVALRQLARDGAKSGIENNSKSTKAALPRWSLSELR